MANEIVQSKEDGIVHARISGEMTPLDQQALERVAKKLIAAGQKISLLVTLEDFKGWKKDPAWAADDVDFQFHHGNDIARIAIVGDHQWRDQAFLYVGKGFRGTEIEFFPPESLNAAKAWISR